MKHVLLYGGIALVALHLYSKRTSSVAVPATLPATGIAVAPAALGGDTVTQFAPQCGCSPDALSYGVERSDFDRVNPFAATST